MREFNLYHSLCQNYSVLCLHNEDSLNIWMKKFDTQKMFFDNNSFVKLVIFFSCLLLRFCLCIYREIKLYQSFLLKVSDTLQYRYVEYVHEEVSCQKNIFG